jgi:hypothetical protein
MASNEEPSYEPLEIFLNAHRNEHKTTVYTNWADV